MFEGLLFKAGERVLMCHSAANLDPKKFRNPEVFDVRREEKTQVPASAHYWPCARSTLRAFARPVSCVIIPIA